MSPIPLPPPDLPDEPPVSSAPDSMLSHTDMGLARVLEDLIDVLIGKGLLQFTDLPEPAQRKLLERRSTRAQLGRSLKLLPGEDDHGVL